MKNTYKVALVLLLMFLTSSNSSAMNRSAWFTNVSGASVGRFVGRAVVGTVRLVLRAANVIGAELESSQNALEARKQEIEALPVQDMTHQLRLELRSIDEKLQNIATSRESVKQFADQPARLAAFVGEVNAAILSEQRSPDEQRQAASVDPQAAADVPVVNEEDEETDYSSAEEN